MTMIFCKFGTPLFASEQGILRNYSKAMPSIKQSISQRKMKLSFHFLVSSLLSLCEPKQERCH